jgi:hypothetical protein
VDEPQNQLGGQSPDFWTGDQMKSLGEQTISGQQSHTFAEDFMGGRFAAAHVVIIHCRQIIMNDGISVNQFHGAGKRHKLLLFSAEHFSGC